MEGGKPENHIKIGVGTRVRSVINYCEILLEKGVKDLNLTAMGGAIGSLILVCENVKILHPGLHQSFKISTINSQTMDNDGQLVQQKLFPKFEVTLSLDEPSEKNEGYQPPLKNEEREKLLKQLNAQNPQQGENRGRGRSFGGAPRGRGRGRGRGGKDFGYEGEEEEEFGGNRFRGRGGNRGFRGSFAPRGRGMGGFVPRGRGFVPRGRGFAPRGRGFGIERGSRGMRGQRGGNRGGYY